MSRPPNQYPNDERKYPNDGPEVDAAALAGLQAALEGELDRLAPSRVTVLLIGGHDSEKHAVALALHERSPRRAEPFIRFDCRGRDSDAVENTLFGGPGYVTLPRGAIHEASAGTLFVSTIDDLPLLTQPRFLRFLDQDRAVRVVASTDIDLPTRVHQGHFRLDLAERLMLVLLRVSSRR